MNTLKSLIIIALPICTGLGANAQGVKERVDDISVDINGTTYNASDYFQNITIERPKIDQMKSRRQRLEQQRNSRQSANHRKPSKNGVGLAPKANVKYNNRHNGGRRVDDRAATENALAQAHRNHEAQLMLQQFVMSQIAAGKSFNPQDINSIINDWIGQRGLVCDSIVANPEFADAPHPTQGLIPEEEEEFVPLDIDEIVAKYEADENSLTDLEMDYYITYLDIMIAASENSDDKDNP